MMGGIGSVCERVGERQEGGVRIAALGVAVGSNRLATLHFAGAGMGELQPGNRAGTRSYRLSADLRALRDNYSDWQKILQQSIFQGISQFKTIKP